MSLFKAREWWTAPAVAPGEEFDLGALCVGNIDNARDGSAKVVTCSFNGILRVYQPGQRGFLAGDLLLEHDFDAAVLQIALGRFISATDELALAVLFPRVLVVYRVQSERQAGVDSNDPSAVQCTVAKAYEHPLERTAANFVWGPFGGAANDHICVQSMDGLLLFFEMETPSFGRFLPNFLLPGPLCYVPSIDSIVTCNAELEIVCFKYQVLAAASASEEKDSEKTLSSSGKRLHVDWATNVGEPVVALCVACLGEPGEVDIVALGQRTLFCVRETGAIRMQKRLDYSPTCLHPARTQSDPVKDNLLVGTSSRNIMVYSGVELAWAAQVDRAPIAMAVGEFAGTRGLLVLLDDQGHLELDYLGTDPSTSVVYAPQRNETNYDEMNEELRQLGGMIRNANSGPRPEPEDQLVLRAQAPELLDISAPTDIAPSLMDDEGLSEELAALPSVTARVSVSYTGTGTVSDITLCVTVQEPIVCQEPSILIPAISGKATPLIIPLVFRCRATSLPASLGVTISASYASGTGQQVRTAECSMRLPLCLAARMVPPSRSADFKVTLETNQQPCALNELFEDFVGDAPSDEQGQASNVMTFAYPNRAEVTILVSKQGGKYRLQSAEMEAVWLVMDELIQRLRARFAQDNLQLSFSDSLPLQEYGILVDHHFELRRDLAKTATELQECAQQFRSVQKRLLVRFKDQNPPPLNNFNLMLEGAYNDIIELGSAHEETSFRLRMAAHRLSAGTRLMLCLICLQFDLDAQNAYVLEQHLTPIVEDSEDLGWEETVDSALTSLLRTTLAKSAKETGAMPMPLTFPPDTSKLKKHLEIVCHRLKRGLRPHKASKRSKGLSRADSSKDSLPAAGEEPRD